MGKKKQELKPDIVVKNYWRNNEQFADFFNAVLFDGEQIIKADELEDIDTEESSILEHKEYAESIGAARDNVKIRKKSTIYNVEMVILGIEGQERIHYAMPMRVMGYDYGTYKKQYDDNAAKYKSANGMSSDEYTHDPGGFGQKFQFGEVLFRLTRILLVPDDRDQYGPLEPGPGSGLVVLRYNLFILFQSIMQFTHGHASSKRRILLHGENKGTPSLRRIPLPNVSSKP